jgi:flavin-dependent dehydrogenase
MNNGPSYFDLAIIGGGLAGLATAIQFGRDGFRVVLFEKEFYPFHKVCGEYISLESMEFLIDLGLPLNEWQLPVMDTLQLSAPNGNMLQEKLPLGGFGVSRYRIDTALMRIAKDSGVEVHDGTKVQEVDFVNNVFNITTDKGMTEAKVCCGAFGKRSNLDIKWKRSFIEQKHTALNNFIGVKYHVTHDHPLNMISLHNFKDGYCGIAAIEDNKINICYLTTAQNLRDHGNNLQKMEQNILFKNPHLKKIFGSAEFLNEKPLTISQISFDKKEQVNAHVLLLGDAAGLITPLCGNGMSMALQSSRIAVKYIRQYFADIIDRNVMELLYTKEWKTSFASRLKAGRIIQGIFGKPWLTNSMISFIKPFPSITRYIIRQTHGSV